MRKMQIDLDEMLSRTRETRDFYRGMMEFCQVRFQMIGDMYVTGGRVFIDHGHLGGGISAHDTIRHDRYDNAFDHHTTVDAGYGKAHISHSLDDFRLDDNLMIKPKKFDHY